MQEHPDIPIETMALQHALDYMELRITGLEIIRKALAHVYAEQL